MDDIVQIIDAEWHGIFIGTHEQVRQWFSENPDDKRPKMVCVGEDMQVFSISEYKSLYG